MYAEVPEPYYTFFVYVEPIATIICAIYASLFPTTFLFHVLPHSQDPAQSAPVVSTAFSMLETAATPFNAKLIHSVISAIRRLGGVYSFFFSSSLYIAPRALEVAVDQATKIVDVLSSTTWTTHLLVSSLGTVRQLGNCYFILGSMSFFFLPKLLKFVHNDSRSTSKSSPSSTSQFNPQVHSILQTYFAILGVFDITHILLTLIDLPFPVSSLPQMLIRPDALLLSGNLITPIILFAWRISWYFSTSIYLQQ